MAFIQPVNYSLNMGCCFILQGYYRLGMSLPKEDIDILKIFPEDSSPPFPIPEIFLPRVYPTISQYCISPRSGRHNHASTPRLLIHSCLLDTLSDLKARIPHMQSQFRYLYGIPHTVYMINIYMLVFQITWQSVLKRIFQINTTYLKFINTNVT